MQTREEREKFAQDVERRTEGYAQNWLDRPGVREKLRAYDHLVTSPEPATKKVA